MRARAGLSIKFQITSVLPGLIVFDNVLLALQARDTLWDLAILRARRRPVERAVGLLADFRLASRADTVAGTLSGGKRKTLAVALALLRQSRVLLLDEPTEGVWVGVIHEIVSRLKQMVWDMAIVIVEQHLELALELADYAYVLARGRLALEGTSHALRNDSRLLRSLAP